MKSQDEKGLHYAIGDLRSVRNSLGVLEVIKWYKFWFVQRWTWYGRRVWKQYQKKYWADISLKHGINKTHDSLEFYFSILVCFMMFWDWAFTVVALCYCLLREELAVEALGAICVQWFCLLQVYFSLDTQTRLTDKLNQNESCCVSCFILHIRLW